MSDLSQGLLISALGIFVTFVALGALILVINVLQWIFPAESRTAKRRISSSHDQDEEIAAAVAVAISLLDDQKRFDPNLGDLLQRPPGPWRRVEED